MAIITIFMQWIIKYRAGIPHSSLLPLQNLYNMLSTCACISIHLYYTMSLIEEHAPSLTCLQLLKSPFNFEGSLLVLIQNIKIPSTIWQWSFSLWSLHLLQYVTLQTYTWPWMLSLTVENTSSSCLVEVVLTIMSSLCSHSFMVPRVVSISLMQLAIAGWPTMIKLWVMTHLLSQLMYMVDFIANVMNNLINHFSALSWLSYLWCY